MPCLGSCPSGKEGKKVTCPKGKSMTGCGFLQALKSMFLFCCHRSKCTVILINTTKKHFNLTIITSYICTSVNESPQRLTKFICSFRKCHSVYGNI